MRNPQPSYRVPTESHRVPGPGNLTELPSPPPYMGDSGLGSCAPPGPGQDPVPSPAPLTAILEGTKPKGRSAGMERCSKCKAPVVAGLDEDVCAFRAHVDPQPLGPLGEALARLAGRGTYDLERAGLEWRLTRRTRWVIQARPPGHQGRGAADVVAEHRCHHEHLPGTPTRWGVGPTSPTADAFDHPPF